MSKQKKTALDLACENLATIFLCENNCAMCEAWTVNHDDVSEKYCKGCNKGDVERWDMECRGILKQYFQEQADIPDGWDIVFEIRDYLLYPDRFDYENANVLYKQINKWIEEYGIEVK